MNLIASVAQQAERLICNQLVGGSSPSASFLDGQVPEWPNGTGCKPVAARLRWFESIPAHHLRSGSSSIGRASAFQAEGCGFESRLPLQIYLFLENRFFQAHVAQSAEHVLGKDGVASSNLAVGLKRNQRRFKYGKT